MNQEQIAKLIIGANRHLSATALQNLLHREHNIILAIGKVKELLEVERAKAHLSGAVVPR